MALASLLALIAVALGLRKTPAPKPSPASERASTVESPSPPSDRRSERLLSQPMLTIPASAIPVAVPTRSPYEPVAAPYPWEAERFRSELKRTEDLLAKGDWAGAEAASRGILALEPGHGQAARHLAQALMRQNRKPEAVEVLKASREVREDEATRHLLRLIQQGLAVEAPLTTQQIAHFQVRYDGEVHEDVGRHVLNTLERHYATLAIAFDHQPATAIPVLLLSREAFEEDLARPKWTGAVYQPFDGQIVVKVGGLSPARTSRLERTLLHELTHAFVDNLVHGPIPSDLNEGLAQYMTGMRVGYDLKPEQVAALEKGGEMEVWTSYQGALSFVEHLLGQRGMGGMKELLKSFGESRDLDRAFRDVYGQTYSASRRSWLARLKQLHS